VYLLNVPTLFSSWRTLGGTAAGLTTAWYDVGLKPGPSRSAYIRDLSQALGPQFTVRLPAGSSGLGGGGSADIASDTSLIRLLTLLVAVLAGLGVLSSVLMVTRERVHDLGVFKALGMTPRQTITMVICWVIAPPSSPQRSPCPPRSSPTRSPSRPSAMSKAPASPPASCTSTGLPSSCCWPPPG
jgi:hypothetical protein